MKSAVYLDWTNAMLRALNVSTYLEQKLDDLIPSEFIPIDDDPDFSRCFNSAEYPPEKTRLTMSAILAEVSPEDESGSSELLCKLIEHVTLCQSSVWFRGTDWTFRRRAPVQLTWSMCAGTQKWSALHGQCITIDIRGSRIWPGDVHSVCGRGYTRFIVDDSEMDLDNEDEPHLTLPPEGERKDDISKDVGMLFSQVAASIKFTNQVADYEAFVWGMCDRSFYLVRGIFPVSYIETIERHPGPLPSSEVAHVHRTIFYDMNTLDGRREAIRSIMALLRYLEWRHLK